MIGTFKANNPYNNFLLVAFGIAIKLPVLLHPQPAKTFATDGFLYTLFLKGFYPIATAFPVLFSFVCVALVVWQAISFNNIVNGQRLLPKPNYLAGMSYILLSTLFTEWYNLSATLIVNSLLIWVWLKLSQLHNSKNPKTVIYNIGLSIGVVGLIYSPGFLFLILAAVGVAVARPFKLPEWLMVIIGVLTPFYFLASWLFLTDQWKNYHVPKLHFSLPIFENNSWVLSALAIIALAVVMGFIFVQANMRRQLIATRKSWQLLYLYFAVALLVPFISSEPSFNYWIIAAIPAAGLIAAALFYPQKKWFPLFVTWVMIGISVALGYFVS